VTTLAVVLALLAPAPGPQVGVVGNAFRPRRVTVRVGRSVTWRWQGRRRHDVWFAEGPRRCRPRRSGRCTRRFSERGTFDYQCTLHGSMTGRVRVRP
jgi:plastocyanin